MLIALTKLLNTFQHILHAKPSHVSFRQVFWCFFFFLSFLDLDMPQSQFLEKSSMNIYRSVSFGAQRQNVMRVQGFLLSVNQPFNKQPKKASAWSADGCRPRHEHQRFRQSSSFREVKPQHCMKQVMRDIRAFQLITLKRQD